MDECQPPHELQNVCTLFRIRLAVSFRRHPCSGGSVLLNRIVSFMVGTLGLLPIPLLAQTSLLQYTNTLQGTDSNAGFSHGGTLPLVGSPWPMLQWSPQTESNDFWEGGGWWFQSTGKAINGFRATRQPSPWMGDYGQFSLMPETGDLKIAKNERESPYDINASIFKPDYCRIDLKRYNITAEMTAAERCAVMRFTYHDQSTGRLIIDPGRKGFSAHVELNGRTIRGFSCANNGGVPNGWKAYFVIHLDRDVTVSGTFDRVSQPHPGEKSIDGDTHVGMYVEFAIGDNRAVEIPIGTSYISYDQAELNLKRETAGGFEATRDRTAKAWEANLARIEVKTSNAEDLKTFYSCLYRAQTFPHKLYELDNDSHPIHFNFYGQDNNKTIPGFLYGDNGFWDVYRTNYPFWAIAFPDQLGEILNGFVQAYRDGGWFPQWPSPGQRSGMVGSHIDAVIADAVTKHIAGFDVNTAYEGIRKNAFVNPPNGSVGRSDFKDYEKLGYVPAHKDAGYSVSSSLDYAYNDWCIAQVAKTLNKTDDYQTLMAKSKNYKLLWDPSVGFFRARNADGSWFGKFDDLAWSTGYVEGGPWQCTWAVDHDPQGLAQLMGGPTAMGDKLDRMMGMPAAFHVGEFHTTIHEMTEMAAVPFGQYAHSNQPVHHVLYLYTAIGQPWKTQYWTRRVCRDLYNSTPEGFCGDEDNGEMSSWYLLSSIGIFPACVGDPNYTLTSPVFDRVTLHLAGSKDFVINTKANTSLNVYVQSRTLDGKDYEPQTISHERLMQGGELNVELGSIPKTGAAGD
jgi:predicted alpha-1,2-mannosidase